MRDAHRLTLAVFAAGLVCLASCASAEGDGTGASDARLDGDGAPIPNPPDADPAAPDANPTSGDPDASTVSCSNSPCDLVPQCGCLASEACDLDSANFATGGTLCRNVSNAGMEASSCNTSDEDCAAGYVCLGANPNFQCRKFCASDADCNGDGAVCFIQITHSGGMDVPGGITCSKACDPLAQSNPTGCPSPGYACHVYVDDPGGAGERFLTDCGVAGVGVEGTTCTRSTDCVAGFDCINSGGTSACRQNCLRPNGACATGSCRGLSPPAMIGGNEYGTCIL